MRKLVLISALAAVLGVGNAAKADENRVNLWPLVGYNDGALDVIWPLGHFKSADDWRFFPIIKDHRTFTIFPELWLNDDSFAVLPFYARYDFGHGTLFPVLWWDLERGNCTHSLFPLYYYNGSERDPLFWAGCGLGGYYRQNEEINHWLLPLYVKTPKKFLSIPYSRLRGGGCLCESYLMGMVGWETDPAGSIDTSWCLPLWYKDHSTLLTLPLELDWAPDGSLRKWFSLPLLSAGWQDGVDWNERYLIAMAGRNVNEKTGYRESWLAPLYYGDNRGTLVTPVYGQTPNCKWGLPGWYSDKEDFVSPLWCHHNDSNGKLDWWMVPPLLTGYGRKNGLEWGFYLANLAGYSKYDDGYNCSWCFPLYFADSEDRFITPFFGCGKTSFWVFPLLYNDENLFVSPLWISAHNRQDESSGWYVPPLLSGGRVEKDGLHDVRFLLGMVGATWGSQAHPRSSWMFPLYYEDDQGRLVTPLYGSNSREGSRWVVPLFYADDSSFISLPYMHYRDETQHSSSYFIPPLLSRYTRYDYGATDFSLMLLYRHKNDAKGKVTRDCLFPLYNYNGKTDEFVSLLFGYIQKSGYVNTWWATPLVGTRSGAKTGGWIFPLFNRKKDVSFEHDLARLDSPTLPDDITFKEVVRCYTNRVRVAKGSTNMVNKVHYSTNEVASINVNSKISGSVLLGSDQDHSVGGYYNSRKKEYVLTEESKRGNKLFFDNESSRKVIFDSVTRQRKGDSMDSTTVALAGIYHRKHQEDSIKGTSYTRTQLLYKLWDREEKNGTVTLDVFPGFTYDSHPDGYSKTSFLWRFFRYEREPGKDAKMDLLFIPVLR